jgi:hypothetical protein
MKARDVLRCIIVFVLSILISLVTIPLERFYGPIFGDIAVVISNVFGRFLGSTFFFGMFWYLESTKRRFYSADVVGVILGAFRTLFDHKITCRNLVIGCFFRAIGSNIRYYLIFHFMRGWDGLGTEQSQAEQPTLHP